MPDIALVVFDEENGKSGHGLLMKSGFLKWYFGMAVFRLIYRKRFKRGVRILSPESGIEILSISLPFSRTSIEVMNKQYLARYLSGICSENECARCFFPSDTDWQDHFKEYTSAALLQPTVFKALLVRVLNELVSKRGLRLDNLDIALLCENGGNDLIQLMKQLEPFVNYLSVASPDKDSVEREIAPVFIDSGLSVFVGSDINSILRSADLIINLGRPEALPGYRIRRNTPVINLEGIGRRDQRGDFPVINGVQFSFPKELLGRYGTDILREYTGAGLSVILMALKAGLFDMQEYNDTIVDSVTRIFKRDECTITGFIGRRGVLTPQEVTRAAGL